jgi:hypothetical protein
MTRSVLASAVGYDYLQTERVVGRIEQPVQHTIDVFSFVQRGDDQQGAS